MGTRDITSWLPNLIGPLNLQIGGVAQTFAKRATVNLILAGIAIGFADNPDQDRTDMTLTVSGGGGGGITALTGDVTASGTGSVAATVVSLTGAGGTLPIASTAAIVQWAAATSAPQIRQADLSTNGATGQPLTIQGQNATGTTSHGGDVTVQSGSGTTAPGDVFIACGGTGVAQFDPAGVTYSVPLVQFGTSVSAPVISQQTTVNPSGQALTIRAQNAGTTGGNAVVSSGSGGTTNGNVELQIAGTAQWRVTPTAIVDVNSLPIQFGTGTMPGTGLVRFPTGATNLIAARNTANTADMVAMAIDTGAALSLTLGTTLAFNTVTINAFTLAAVNSSSTVELQVAGTAQWRATSTALVNVQNTPIQFGTGSLPAIGALRFPYNGSGEIVLGAKNSVNNDVAFMSWSSGNVLCIGADNTLTASQISQLTFSVSSSSLFQYVIGGSTYFEMDTNATAGPRFLFFLSSQPCFIQQSAISAASTSGQTMNVNAQAVTGTGASDGGKLLLSGGTSTNGVYGLTQIGSGLDEGRLPFTFPSDANQTLTAAQSANNVLDIQAGVITAGRTITISRRAAAPGQIWVKNRTAQTITIVWLTGTGITIATGASAYVGSDGTNAIALN